MRSGRAASIVECAPGSQSATIGRVTTEGELAAPGNTRPDAALPKACPTCRARYPEEALFCSLDGAPLATATSAIAATVDPYVGREIAGSIEIRQLVGLGSMGRVYRGFQRGIDRDVAVKILHRELSTNPVVVARFEREAKVASRLQHPHVVHVLLTGTLADGAMYLVMEYLDGLSLQSALAGAGGSMPLERAVHIAVALCDAVGEAHAQGIVHRDVKPENVMLVRRGDDPDFVKVLDFGIARFAGGEPTMATAEGLIFGTARYISPEAAQGASVGPPGDVYSMATLLYQMLAGRTPFEGEQAISLLVSQIHESPPPLKSLARGSSVPDRLATVVMQNLAKRPEDRAQDGRALGLAIRQAVAAEGIRLAPSVVETPSPRAPAVTEVSDGPRRPLAVSTTRWSPAAAFGLRRPARSAGLDATLDETTPPPGRPVQPTVPAPPLGAGSVSSAGVASASGHGTGVTNEFREATRHTSRAETGLYIGARVWARPWTTVLVAGCFVLGVVGMVLLATHLAASLLGAKSWRSLDTEVARASEALLHQKWDLPRGDNVRDITDQGLRRWPHEPQLLRIRSLASADIVKAARARRDEGNLTEALRLSRLAYELDPSDIASQRLVADFEAQAQAPATESVPPLASAREAASVAPAPVGAVRASLELSIARPSAGQPIDFVARIAGGPTAGRTSVQGAVFRIGGPGIAAGTSLDAVEAGAGVYRATFAFLQAGRFDVLFVARLADGALVRSARTVVVGGPQGPNAPPVPTVAPSAAAPWM